VTRSPRSSSWGSGSLRATERSSAAARSCGWPPGAASSGSAGSAESGTLARGPAAPFPNDVRGLCERGHDRVGATPLRWRLFDADTDRVHATLRCRKDVELLD